MVKCHCKQGWLFDNLQIKHGFEGNMQFTDWAVKARLLYGPKLRVIYRLSFDCPIHKLHIAWKDIYAKIYANVGFYDVD